MTLNSFTTAVLALVTNQNPSQRSVKWVAVLTVPSSKEIMTLDSRMTRVYEELWCCWLSLPRFSKRIYIGSTLALVAGLVAFEQVVLRTAADIMREEEQQLIVRNTPTKLVLSMSLITQRKMYQL